MEKNFIPSLTNILEEDEELETVGDLDKCEQQQVGFNTNFLSDNGFDVIEYLNEGKYGKVYSAIANQLAIKFYPINQLPEGGVIGENVWKSGNQLYEERSLTGIKVAIKYVPSPPLELWDDPGDMPEPFLLSNVGGYRGLLSADFPEMIGHPLEEVRKLMKLNHKNLVEIYNVLEDNERGVYIVMQFFEMTLKEWVEGMNQNNVRLDDKSIEIFLSQLIDGLSYLHKNNIIHNDFHSGNVMITEDDDESLLFKIVDFGQSEYFSEFNSPVADIKGLGHILRLVMSLLDSEHPEFEVALNDFIYTCVKGVYSNMSEVQKEFESMQQILEKEE